MNRFSERVVIEIFVVSVILALVGMVFGPFGYQKLSIAFSVSAGILALGGLLFSFFVWGKN